jgi:F-type H+-transporting ATPase subunit b
MKSLVFLLMLLAPVFAAEAEHEGGGHNEPSILWKWANFAMLAGGLGYLIGKHAGPYFESRNQEIQGALQDAEARRKDAEARIAAIEGKVANLDAEIKSMREGAKAEIASEAERMQALTAKLLAKIQAQAEMEIASAAKHAKQQLKVLSADLAIQLASAQIREQMTPATQEKLVREFVAKVGTASGN